MTTVTKSIFAANFSRSHGSGGGGAGTFGIGEEFSPIRDSAMDAAKHPARPWPNN
jgi:hypothetical protein